MARRASEPDGRGRRTCTRSGSSRSCFLLPGLYALIVPAIRLTLTQWRVKQAPVYRRVYTAAAIGIAYGCARLVYMAVLPAGSRPAGLPVEPHRDVAGAPRAQARSPSG